MQSSLLTTRLYFPPARPALVPRSRLVERLEKGLSGPLTLISAPAGYGKTTLMSEWRSGAGSAFPVAWFSIDSGDNNPFRFWGYVMAALSTLDSIFASTATTLLQSAQFPPADEFIVTLINSISNFTKDFTLVLDDYHLITAPEIHQYLIFLVDHLPQHMHLILLTRSDPALPLARLRARGQLTEIRAEHLRFSVDEAAKLLNQVMGLGLTVEQAAAFWKSGLLHAHWLNYRISLPTMTAMTLCVRSWLPWIFLPGWKMKHPSNGVIPAQKRAKLKQRQPRKC